MSDANGCIRDDDNDGGDDKDEVVVFADRNANGDAGTDGGDTEVETPDSAPSVTLAEATCKPMGSGNDGAAEVVDAENEKENDGNAEGSVEAAGAVAAAGASKN
jgi:hypothetical protein